MAEQGRLPREENPTPGEKPGFVGSFKKSDGTYVRTGENNPLPVNGNVTLTGSTMEYYGATETERPLVADVPVGATYMAVQTQKIWQSDGTNWVVM